MTHHREDVASPEGSGEGIGPCADPTQRADRALTEFSFNILGLACDDHALIVDQPTEISQETKSTTTPQEQRKVRESPLRILRMNPGLFQDFFRPTLGSRDSCSKLTEAEY